MPAKDLSAYNARYYELNKVKICKQHVDYRRRSFIEAYKKELCEKEDTLHSLKK